MTSDSTVRCFTVSDFMRLVSDTNAGINSRLNQLFEAGSPPEGRKGLYYSIPTEVKKEEILLEILKKFVSDSQVVGSLERRQVWESGWEDNLNAFVSSNFDRSTLVPKFIRPSKVLRYKSDFIVPLNDSFELEFYTLLRRWFSLKYFDSVETIYEFGAGTGFNLLDIAEIYPDKNLIGSDFVMPSVSLLNTIGTALSKKISGVLFDMRKPNYNLKLIPGSGIFTFGALEQLAGDVDAVLEFFVSQEPAVCVHIEPDADFYNKDNLNDYLGYIFQTRRGYTHGLGKKLSKLQERGLINLIHSRRLGFGSLMMEGYNLFVWSPTHKSL